MTKSRQVRQAQRYACGKCGTPGRWGEACVMCGATYTASEVLTPSYVPRLRVAHGTTCTYGDDPHPCHCYGRKAHPCQCYESPA